MKALSPGNLNPKLEAKLTIQGGYQHQDKTKWQ